MAENPLIEQILKKPPDKWTNMNIAVMLCEFYGDIKHIRRSVDKKANKWVEKVVGIFMLGTTGWALKQVAELIEIAKAMFE